MIKKLHIFFSATGGSILVFWAMTLVVIIGLVALSFDIGRIASTHAQLQAFSDQVALAAAGELDGNSDSITRATNAANEMISGSQTFGTGSHTLFGSTNFTLAFYATLPADDTSPLGTPTTDPVKAQYVAVTAAPQTVSLTFAAALYSLLGKSMPAAITQAQSVAGFTQYACDITPLMFCVPHETDSNGNVIPYKADKHIGDMILLRSGGSGSAWGPGDFGFLDPNASGIGVDPAGPCASLSGVKYRDCLLAAEGNISQCFSQRGVTTEPGQQVGIGNAVFNVRFDMYDATIKSLAAKDPSSYPPAPDVVKGLTTSCGGQPPQPTNDTIALPRDSCLISGANCPTIAAGGDGPRFGNGTWDSVKYLGTNWINSNPPGGWSGGTRYSLYQSEISNPSVPGTSILPSGLAETGLPSCVTPASVHPERRVLIAAGVDCAENPISGKTNNVPVTEFFKLFLTEPVGQDSATPPNMSIYGEILGSAQGYGGAAGKGGLFHDVVQLYR